MSLSKVLNINSDGKCFFLVESMWGRETLLKEESFTFNKDTFVNMFV